MSQPHHFVFNELERLIRNSVPDNRNLVDLLIKKDVLKAADRGKFVGKNGMRCLTSYMRIKDFRTFVTFVECIRDIGDHDLDVDVSILETIRGAVRTFDENHGTQYQDQIPQLKEGMAVCEKESSAVSLVPEPIVAQDEMELQFFSTDPLKIVIGPNGGKLASLITDFEIDIPKGAVREQVTIKAVSCAYGKFVLPNDMYRISDFLCVTANQQLLCPATVHMAHCLNMPEYETTAAIAIYHTDMTQYNKENGFKFSLLDVETKISKTKPFVSFSVSEFCIFCAVYRPQYYRGLQKQSSFEKHSANTDPHVRPKQNSVSPYVKPIPTLDYVLLFYEQQMRKSPFQVRIYACVNCPGAIELCNKRMKQQNVWAANPVSKNFDFTSSRILFMNIVEIKSRGWEIAIKSQCINECDIQRPVVTNCHGKKIDRKEAKWYITNEFYPPNMILDIVNVESRATYLKLRITIKDGKDGADVIPDPYDVVLPAPTDHGIQSTPVQLLKRSLSADEKKCLEDTVTTQSLARISFYICDWKLVASKLQLSKSEIEHLQYNNKDETLWETQYQMLLQWHRSTELSCYRKLIEIFKNCEENEAANYIIENITTFSSLTNTI